MAMLTKKNKKKHLYSLRYAKFSYQNVLDQILDEYMRIFDLNPIYFLCIRAVEAAQAAYRFDLASASAFRDSPTSPNPSSRHREEEEEEEE
jgi:hypothetical protein